MIKENPSYSRQFSDEDLAVDKAVVVSISSYQWPLLSLHLFIAGRNYIG
jgi:hypothetical protein